MARNSLKSVSRLIDIANTNVPVEEQFRTDLCRSIEITDEKSARLPSQTFKPSSMTCKRGCYYQIMGVKPDESKSTYTMIGICDSGTDIHVRTQKAVMQMKENGMDCEWVDVEEYVKANELNYLEIKSKTDTETKLYDTRYNISFMCDGIIKYKGKLYILEIKTETSGKWYSRTGVNPKHYNQAISYSNSLKLNDVIFLYIDRDMSNKKAYLYHVTDDMRASLVDFIKDTQGYVDRKVVPPKPEDAGRSKCTYCSYQSQCKKDG